MVGGVVRRCAQGPLAKTNTPPSPYGRNVPWLGVSQPRRKKQAAAAQMRGGEWRGWGQSNPGRQTGRQADRRTHTHPGGLV